MTTINLQETLDNFVNDNLSDFQKEIRNLTKKELLQLITLWKEQVPGETIPGIINHISRWL